MTMFKKTAFLTLCLLSQAFMSYAHDVDIPSFLYRGPVKISAPLMIDSVDVNNNGYDMTALLDFQTSAPMLDAEKVSGDIILGSENPEMHFLSFTLDNKRYADVDIKITGSENYRLYVDGKKSSSSFSIKPGTRDVTVKLLTLPGKTDTVNVSVEASVPDVSISSDVKNRQYTLDDVIFTRHINRVDVSPSGKYALVRTSKTSPGQRAVTRTDLIELPSAKLKGQVESTARWMEKRDMLWTTRKETDGSRSVVTINPSNMITEVFAARIPDGDFMISPDETKLIYFLENEGPKEDPMIYRVINPEDRQPGWRKRSALATYDLSTGIFSPLTFGNKNVMMQDITDDGRRILLMTSRNRFEKRPTTVFSLFDYDIANGKADTLVVDDGFISGAIYSPDGTKVLITGSPESLGGIGKNVPEGKIPNMTEGEFFVMDLADKSVKPATKYFNPSVGYTMWNKGNGKIYFSAENKDKVSLFCYDPASGKFTDLDSPEEMVKNFSLSLDGTAGALIGESAANPEALYFMEMKKGKPSYKAMDTTADALADVTLAEVVGWDFINSKGDTINGRFYLPPGFDPSRKYPMIVNYYGGCSPTGRNFATRYPHHLYANQGYVVYVINPSGATGFGQEFASRHVNTAGSGVAEDIIEGTLKFIEEHPYIDKEKIGCIGASYGGFMTQYLQTVTDIFAAAISHAGISDHTSYWGNGYWGYSYSEVSMADSYPWSDSDLYVKQSPLYNADKIDTPILFLHGDGDTNVPPAESIQLFTALKLLGKDTALVEVTDQNHHILDNEKREKWQDTIFAWFAKYLQDDSSWWDALYPPTPL